MQKLNIKFDLDGCLVDFTGHLSRVLHETYNAEILETGDFKIETNPTITQRQLFEAFRTVYREHKMTAIYPGATDLFRWLHGRSQQPIHIVTSRPYDCAHHTHALVHRIAKGVPVTISFATPPLSKLNYLNGTKYFVEDRKSIAGQIALLGKYVFMPRRPWNESIVHPNILRIDGVADLLNKVDWFVEDDVQITMTAETR